jgi:hypothetical protein
MGGDIYLQIVDHFFSMVKVLNGEENGHGKCKKGDQTYDNLKSEAFIELYLSHRFSVGRNLIFSKLMPASD